MNTKRARLMEILRSSGREMWIGEICAAMGLPFPTGLELIRPQLNNLSRQGKLVKSVRPTNETRRAYYSLPTEEVGGRT